MSIHNGGVVLCSIVVLFPAVLIIVNCCHIWGWRSCLDILYLIIGVGGLCINNDYNNAVLHGPFPFNLWPCLNLVMAIQHCNSVLIAMST